jgi:hypothetical protein
MATQPGWAFPRVIPGMSRREHYVGQALAGLCASARMNTPYKIIAENAIRIADAVIKEIQE